MTLEDKNNIIKALEAKKAINPCPRCGNKHFSVIDGYFSQSIQKTFVGIVIGGPAIPSVIAICTNCGFMSQHALGPLDLLPKTTDAKKN